MILVVKIDCEIQIAHNRATFTSSGFSIEFVNEFVEHTPDQMPASWINNRANAQGSCLHANTRHEPLL